MLVKLGEGKEARVVTIEPGESKIEPLSEGQMLMKVGYRASRAVDRTLYDNQFRLTKGYRANVFLYKAHRENSRVPVLLSMTQEKPPKLPTKRRKK